MSRFKLFLLAILVTVFAFSASETYAKSCCGDRQPGQTQLWWYYDESRNTCINFTTQGEKPIECDPGQICLSDPDIPQDSGQCATPGRPTPPLVDCGNPGQQCCRRKPTELGWCNLAVAVPDDHNSQSCTCIAAYAGMPLEGVPPVTKKFAEDVNRYQETGDMSLGPWTQQAFFGTLNTVLTEIDPAIFGLKENSSGRQIGTLSGVGYLVAGLLTSPPASTQEYLADLGESLGLARPVYAQGVGFNAMREILPVWKASRNVAYFVFILVFLFAGFAIMFRLKISPQAVVGLQNALPKAIIALLLVTFSYAIVGLLIDLSYLLLYLAILALGQTGWINVPQEQFKFANLNFWGGWGLIYGGAVRTLFSAAGAMFDSAVTGGPGLGSVAGGLVAGAVGIIGTAIFLLVALYIMFKLFFTLLLCYVQIVMAIIFGPIQIAFSALPTGKGGFGTWLNNLFANIMVFPATAFMMLLGWTLTSKINSAGAWAPPLMGDRHDLVMPMLGFGILMLTGKVPEIVKNALKVKDAGFGSAIGQAVYNPVTQFATQAWSNREQARYLSTQAGGRTNLFGQAAKTLSDALRVAGKVK